MTTLDKIEQILATHSRENQGEARAAAQEAMGFAAAQVSEMQQRQHDLERKMLKEVDGTNRMVKRQEESMRSHVDDKLRETTKSWHSLGVHHPAAHSMAALHHHSVASPL